LISVAVGPGAGLVLTTAVMVAGNLGPPLDVLELVSFGLDLVAVLAINQILGY
jgi:hypothetical protein